MSSVMSKIHPTVYRIDLTDNEFADGYDGKFGGSRKRKSEGEHDKASKNPRSDDENLTSDDPDKQTRIILSAIADLKSSLEKKLSKLEDRLTSKLKEEFDEEINNVKINTYREIKSLDEYIQAVENFAKSQPCSDENDAVNKIVFMNLPEEEDEDTSKKVNAIIRDQLNLPDISIVCTERKRSYSPRKPGIIIATCGSLDDKIAILKNKTNLKSTRNFNDVYIVPYSTRSEQKQMKNLKKMVQIMGEDKLINIHNHRMRDNVQFRRRNYVNDEEGRHSSRRRSPKRDECHANRSRSDHR